MTDDERNIHVITDEDTIGWYWTFMLYAALGCVHYSCLVPSGLGSGLYQDWVQNNDYMINQIHFML